MMKFFGFSHRDEEEVDDEQPTLLSPATSAERRPPPPQVRQSRLGAPYEASAHVKKEVPKHVSTVHKAKVPPQSNPSGGRVSRLGSTFEDTSRPVARASNSSAMRRNPLKIQTIQSSHSCSLVWLVMTRQSHSLLFLLIPLKMKIKIN